jgi:hypothetical protein
LKDSNAQYLVTVGPILEAAKTAAKECGTIKVYSILLGLYLSGAKMLPDITKKHRFYPQVDIHN